MPTIAQCSKCKRYGGFAELATDKICARCKKKSGGKAEEKNQDDFIHPALKK